MILYPSLGCNGKLKVIEHVIRWDVVNKRTNEYKRIFDPCHGALRFEIGFDLCNFLKSENCHSNKIFMTKLSPRQMHARN